MSKLSFCLCLLGVTLATGLHSHALADERDIENELKALDAPMSVDDTPTLDEIEADLANRSPESADEVFTPEYLEQINTETQALNAQKEEDRQAHWRMLEFYTRH